MFKCLMIDVDGVVVRGRPGDGLPWTHDLEVDLGIEHSVLEELLFKPLWQSIISGKEDLRSHLTKLMCEIFAEHSADELMAYWFQMDSRLNDRILNDFKVARSLGLEIFLTTNQERYRADYLMNEVGLNRIVDGMMYSADIGFCKPDQEFFAQVSLRTGYKPREHLFIDDSKRNVEAAEKFGWKAIEWQNNSRLEEILKNTNFK